jgi:uncharacterized RDD family membrane protein YckC/Tfp pilus assembly protein PilE
MSNRWFYVDATGQQVGPISEDELRAAIRRGAATPATLAWREGLQSWQPISQLMSELGLEFAATPPPTPTPGATADPAGNPYRTPDTVNPEILFRGGGEIVYAGFWRRFAARVLDGFVVAIPTWLIFFIVVGGMASMTRLESNDPAAAIPAVLAVYVLPLLLNFLYFSLMHSSSLQATVGKLALGIKVTDERGQRLSFGQAAGRWFATALSYLTVYVGFILAGFTERKRALHDMLASTLVVDKWAYTGNPERQQRGVSGCLIVFIVIFVGGIFIVPILAAISISQYQDYVIRSQVSEGASLADGVKTAYGEYVNNRGEMPTTNADAGLAAPASIRGEYVSYVDIGRAPGRIEIGYSSYPPNKANSMLDGKHLLFDAKVEGGAINWTCHSDDLKQKWCPSSCNCGG